MNGIESDPIVFKSGDQIKSNRSDHGNKSNQIKSSFCDKSLPSSFTTRNYFL